MRRAQAATEFLMTYGWAILVVLAAIVALSYFGVISPDRLLPSKCTANPPFTCTQYKVSGSANTVTFSLSGNAGTDITLNYLTISCDGTTNVTTAKLNVGGAVVNATYGVGQFLSNGNAVNVILTDDDGSGGCATKPPTGNRLKVGYTIVYTKVGETVTHTATGSLLARVE